MSLPFSLQNDDILLNIRLTPKGGRDSVDGIITLSDGRPVLAARVRAVPEDGAANAALLTLLASTLAIPASSLSLMSGASSRIKRVKLPYSAAAIQKLTALIQKTI